MVVIVGQGPTGAYAPVCDASIFVVSGAERTPVDTPASCRWAYPVRVGSEGTTLEVAADGFETQTVTLAPGGTSGRPCGGAGGCEIVWLR
jgi:hypothetical protein